MVGMNGIGAVPGPANTVPSQATDKKYQQKTAANVGGDAAVFSRRAEDVAVALNAQDTDVYEAYRQERLEQARQNLEQGLHKVQGLIEIVASRVSRYIEPEV